MGYNPHTFSGTVGAMELCKWFEEIEAIFQYGSCSKGNKIKFSTTMLCYDVDMVVLSIITVQVGRNFICYIHEYCEYNYDNL